VKHLVNEKRTENKCFAIVTQVVTSLGTSHVFEPGNIHVAGGHMSLSMRKSKSLLAIETCSC